MTHRRAAIIAALLLTLLAEPVATSATALPLPSLPAGASGQSVTTRTNGASSPEAPPADDVVRWQSDVTTPHSDRAPRVMALKAATDRRTHRVQVVVATPATTSKGTVKRWVTDTDVDRLLTKVSDYWSEQSAGKIRFVRSAPIARIETGDGTCTTTGRILKQVKRGGAKHYGPDWYSSSKRGPGVREHLVVLFPYRKGDVPGARGDGRTCAGTLGLGSMPRKAGRDNPGGWSFSLFGGPDGATAKKRFSHPQYDSGVTTLAHELGHNLGLEHSGVGWCDGAADGSMRSSRCGAVEGLDPLDLMGASFAARGTTDMSGAQKRRLGVLPSSEVVTVSRKTGGRSVRIAARHRDSRLPSLVRVVDPRTHESYYVELRQRAPGVTYPLLRLPWRASSDYRVTYGVTVSRVAGDKSTWAYPGEHLLVPMGPVAHRRSTLAEGKSFTTRTGAARITVAATSDGAARVRVTFPR